MRYLAYCLCNLDYSEALEVAYDHLADEKVVLVERSSDSEFRIKILSYKDDKAKSYGWDLYLFAIDEYNKSILVSRGSFN